MMIGNEGQKRPNLEMEVYDDLTLPSEAHASSPSKP